MHVRLSVSTIVAAAIALASNLAAAQAPSISHTIPAAVTPGQASDIVLFGGNLAGPTGIWLGMTAESALTPGLDKNGTEAGQVSYRVTTPATVPVGIYGLRLASSGGISNMRLVMVDDLPSASDNGGNKSLDTAQEIALPIAVDGACEPESYDFYRFNGVAGQRITVEVVARRLGYPLDPVIRLLDSSGHELAYSDDAPASAPTADSLTRFRRRARITSSCATFVTPGVALIDTDCGSATSRWLPRPIRWAGGAAAAPNCSLPATLPRNCLRSWCQFRARAPASGSKSRQSFPADRDRR